ncbi:glycerophosphodiester phosphodiesterase [Kribbella sandramycini]|uniref:glycerophosphodiester phosphodiesterase n=1 Tax=Kribbella sandramycini TaxID=60450 RepID=A0A7Y4L0W3_9ACTN|nr:glycerophosphodiester phosphodiesterase family protein [Kribbella sandramycini]MBB6564520.1 glycerophosphoryl diester phosphodiesterase [Kribbella sandramycini]NOL42224.1 glycerophosphodiester phosphodiesterase [Kribbella sandramycini]
MLVIAHRGASGYRPEHTPAAYRLAAAQGADYIEPDLVATLDGVLVCRHENEISGTTDVAHRPVFADRRITKVIDGEAVTGWFVEDFTYAELRTLRARERMPALRSSNTAYDGLEAIPTFDDVVALARQESLRLGRPIGVIPEIKRPAYFRRLGLPLEELLTERILALRLRPAEIMVQSFEPTSLRRLAVMTRVPLVQLIDAESAPSDLLRLGDRRTFADLLEPAGLRDIATYAQVLAPHKDLVIPRTPTGALGEPTRLVGQAHRAGLSVQLWTFRAERRFLPTATDFRTELTRFARLGIAGIFTDHPDQAATTLKPAALPG